MSYTTGSIDLGSCTTSTALGLGNATYTVAAAKAGFKVVVVSATLTGLTSDLKIGSRTVLSGAYQATVMGPVNASWIIGADGEAMTYVVSGTSALCVTWCYLPTITFSGTGVAIS